MSVQAQVARLSSRWIAEFEKQLLRRKHIVLYGNIHDLFLCRGQYQSVNDFLMSMFCDRGFDVIVRYDPIDGFTFVGENRPRQDRGQQEALPADIGDRFRELVRRGVAERNPAVMGTQHADPVPVAGPGNDPLQPPERRPPGPPARQQQHHQRVSAEDAFGDLRLVLRQDLASVAAVVDLGDMLTSDPNRYTGDERNALMLLKKCTLEASVIPAGRPLAGYRNTLVILAGELKRVPAWFYMENPYVSLVHVARPDKDERRQFALQYIRPSGSFGGFLGGNLISLQRPSPNLPSELELVADEFADLTDGMQSIDLDALRTTSHTANIAVRPKEVRRLVDYFKFGLKEDPWERLDSGRVKSAREILSKRVIGQPLAVDAVVSMLTRARVGLSLRGGSGSAKPKGMFFFVGPTGVGKTELAKALTELVFSDEKAFARFDMSEYKEEHAAEKLAGAPPGFVGYDEGGQLTSRVLQQPHSILLFDEIEKAHPRVLDKFLQILEDGRLTDGKGQTAYFNQTAIVFTSNIGASDLADPTEGTVIRPGIMNRVREEGADQFGYEDVARHFRAEVEWHFTTKIGRAELFNRLGDNIVVFDILRPEYVTQIGRKFLGQLEAVSQEKFDLALRFLPSVDEMLVREMSKGENMLLGGRRIGALLESLVERPLNRWLFENVSDYSSLAGRALEVGISAQSLLEVKLV
jgi:energy-coupling factor transporter ATP-binding protein EcfA2